jgi:hypothetical protein
LTLAVSESDQEFSSFFFLSNVRILHIKNTLETSNTRKREQSPLNKT